MSPLDAHAEVAVPPLVQPSAAIVLPGGRIALVIERSPAPLPAAGIVDGAGSWTAFAWEAERGQAALALLPAMPSHESWLLGVDGELVARLARPGYLDVGAAPLVRLVRKAGGRAGALLAFLNAQLGSVAPGLIAEFLAGAAERDGFVEVAARTECGGLYLQGWAQSLEAGFVQILGLDAHEPREMAVAHFKRDDILPPASGVCLFAKCVSEGAPIPSALYFERDERLGRLDVVPTLAAPLSGPAATGHVRAMLERIEAPLNTLGAFRRICRPRYEGQDTLSSYPGPIAAAFDRVLRACDGTLLVSGWMLDPLSRVEHVILKSRANLYAPLHNTWNLLPRPDLNKGFAENPRFAGLLDERDVMHGFVCHAPARPEQTAEEVYLELVLDDGSCLFRPVEVTPCQGEGVLPAILGGLSADEPELPQIVVGHLAPFLAGVAQQTRPLKQIARPTPLGSGKAGREVGAVMPVAGLAELQPVLAALANTPDAGMMDLTLVAGRRVATEIRQAVDDAFRFYGLTGELVVVPDHATLAARLDAGIGAGTAERVLIWRPSALPKGSGWLSRLIAEADRPGAGLVSPVLTYEDGSIYFGGARPELASRDTTCARAGFGGAALRGTDATPVSAGAAEISLIHRSLLAAAGGVSGHLFGDAYTHLDLARRLREVGAQAWCAPSVDFWMVEDPRAEDDGPFAQMTRAVDAALIVRRTKEETGQ
jgi:hypothetical protein